jgi:hypothetical protein
MRPRASGTGHDELAPADGRQGRPGRRRGGRRAPPARPMAPTLSRLGALPALQALLAALVFTALWGLVHPALPHHPDSDLYDCLCVTRHLARGEGLQSDIIYPLSLAFPWARKIPQPLLHRQPGQPLLLLVPYVVAGGDARAVLVAVYWLHLLLLGLLFWWMGRWLLVNDLPEALPAWGLLLLLSPVLGMSVAWARVEVAAALVLALLWLRWREPVSGSQGAVADGVLAAMLVLLRADLFWLPPLWWLVWRRAAGRRDALLAGGTWLLLLAPWFIRMAHITGNPFFSLQMQAEHLKGTSGWPEYSIYRSLHPEPFTTTLLHEPSLLAGKALSGMRFFLRNAGRWLAWPLCVAWLLLLGREASRSGLRATVSRPGPLLLALLSTGLLAGQYSLFSHTLRHLVVLLPIVSLEIVVAGASWLRRGRLATPGRGWLLGRGLLLALGIGAAVLAAPPRLPGWEAALEQARQTQPAVARVVRRADQMPPGPVFTDSGAILWLTGRAGVWRPLDSEVESRIRTLLPAMSRAPVLVAVSDWRQR